MGDLANDVVQVADKTGVYEEWMQLITPTCALEAVLLFQVAAAIPAKWCLLASVGGQPTGVVQSGVAFDVEIVLRDQYDNL